MLKKLGFLKMAVIVCGFLLLMTGCSMDYSSSDPSTGGGGTDTGGGSTDGGSTDDIVADEVELPGELADLTDIGDLLDGVGDNWYFTKVMAIAEDGNIVGQSNAGGPVKAAFLWDATSETMTYLGIHPGGPWSDYYFLKEEPPNDWLIYSEAVGISSLGEVIGNSTTGAGWPEEPAKRGFYWSPGTGFVDLAPNHWEKDIDTLTVESFSEAIAINDDYVLVNADGKTGRHGYYWDKVSTKQYTVLDDADNPVTIIMPDYDVLGGVVGADSEAVAINSYNQAILNSGGTVIFHDIDKGVVEALNQLPGASSTSAVDINDSQPTGHVVGTSGNEAFFWDGGAMYPCGSLGGGISMATDINNHDQVVGNSKATNGNTHAFVWALSSNGQGVMTDLGTLGGKNSWATAINDNGVVIGYSETGETYTQGEQSRAVVHGCVWYDNIIYDLGIHNDFYEYPFVQSYPFSEAVVINESNRIAGNSTTINSHSRGFIIDPVFP
ncbi:MAG: DUF3466 family protein [Desulfobacteraceae bacterium]|nr:DUF3466 family protein [Desulfobacteraceae bacterium]